MVVTRTNEIGNVWVDGKLDNGTARPNINLSQDTNIKSTISVEQADQYTGNVFIGRFISAGGTENFDGYIALFSSIKKNYQRMKFYRTIMLGEGGINNVTKITPGAIRFNTDSMKLEYYHLGSAGIGTLATGEWVQITTDTPDIQTGGTRGLFAGGFGPSPSTNTRYDDIQYIQINTPQEMRLILEL